MPEHLHVVLGGSQGGLRTLRVNDFMAYFRAARARFDDAVGPNAPSPPIPRRRPTPSRSTIATSAAGGSTARPVAATTTTSAWWRASAVDSANRWSSAAWTPSRRSGSCRCPWFPPLERTSASALERVREQARIQLEGRRQRRPLYELLTPPPGEPIPPDLGLAALPPPSPGDLFFDIEGDPYTGDDGMEYLFGVMDLDGTWHPIWSQDDNGEFSPAGEKRAFEQVMDLFAARLWQYPEAHIFHFAPYEPTALKRLMGRHATREDEVDRLLRGAAMVDLFRVVKQGLRASVESYSIKKLEPLYGLTREVDLRDAGSSIAVFEEWLQLPGTERPTANHLERIERYNRDDVRSTLELRAWLEERRDELAELTGQEVPRKTPQDPTPSPTLERAPGEGRRPRGSADGRRAGHGSDSPRRRVGGCWPSSCRGTAAKTRAHGGCTSISRTT